MDFEQEVYGNFGSQINTLKGKILWKCNCNKLTFCIEKVQFYISLKIIKNSKKWTIFYENFTNFPG